MLTADSFMFFRVLFVCEKVAVRNVTVNGLLLLAGFHIDDAFKVRHFSDVLIESN